MCIHREEQLVSLKMMDCFYSVVVTNQLYFWLLVPEGTESSWGWRHGGRSMSSTGRMHPDMKQTEQEVGHSSPLKCTSSIKALVSTLLTFLLTVLLGNEPMETNSSHPNFKWLARGEQRFRLEWKWRALHATAMPTRKKHSYTSRNFNINEC